jgi:cytochrome b561
MTDLEKYPKSMRITHWLSAVLILGMLPLGWYMTSLNDSNPNQMKLFNLHQSVGVCILVLALGRILIKLKTPHPELPSDLSIWEKRLAQGIHSFLYILLIIMPISGILMTLLSGYQVPFFFFEFPNGLTENRVLSKTFEKLHGVLAYGLATLIIMHLAGLLKELVIGKRNLLKRMI